MNAHLTPSEAVKLIKVGDHVSWTTGKLEVRGEVVTAEIQENSLYLLIGSIRRKLLHDREYIAIDGMDEIFRLPIRDMIFRQYEAENELQLRIRKASAEFLFVIQPCRANR